MRQKSKKILVTYGNKEYYRSLDRIKNEAVNLNIFDKVITYIDKDLPPEITSSKLYKYSRGDGYWIWKPWIILQTLKAMNENDILVYVDAGCSLFKNKEWNEWFDILNTSNGLFFAYGATMQERCRKNLLQYFEKDIPFLKYYVQLESSVMLLKKEAIRVIEEWYYLMLNNEEFVVDVDKDLLFLEDKKFVEHRHDQAVLSCVIYREEINHKLKIIWDRMESFKRNGQAIHVSRISDTKIRSPRKYDSIFVIVIKKFVLVPYRTLRMRVLKGLNAIKKSRNNYFYL